MSIRFQIKKSPAGNNPTGHISYVRYHLVHTYSIGDNGATAFFYFSLTEIQKKKLPDEPIRAASVIFTIHDLSEKRLPI